MNVSNTIKIVLILSYMICNGCVNRSKEKIIPHSNVYEVCECIDKIDESNQINMIKSNLNDCFHKLDTVFFKNEGRHGLENAFDSLYNNCNCLNELLASIYIIENNVDTTENIINSTDCLSFRNNAFLYYGHQEDTLFIYDGYILDKTRFGTEKHSIQWLNNCTYEYKTSESEWIKVSFINKIADTITFRTSERILDNSYLKFIILH